MITRLHPNDKEEQKVHCYITRLTQAIQEKLYLFRIITMHDTKDQKVKLKLKKVPSTTTRAKTTTPTTGATATNNSLGPLQELQKPSIQE